MAQVTLTAEDFVKIASLADGIYWVEVNGDDVTVTVTEGEPFRGYGLRGPASGSITVTGYGSSHRRGSGSGSAYRTGDGSGGAYREGSGPGDAVRDGSGSGSAFREGSGSGDARRSGSGNGNARRYDSGDGSACRTGSGIGNAHHSGSGVGFEEDFLGKRRSIPYDISTKGIPFRCNYGEDWLRVGCELHTLNDWIANADEIDWKHGGGIARLTRELATKLKSNFSTKA